MVRQLHVFLLIAGTTFCGAKLRRANQAQSPQDHIAWVTESMKRMETVKPGMTRQMLLTVFTTEGGWCTALHRTFVSRGCPYFRVDVKLKAVGRPQRKIDRRLSSVEGDQDLIVSISRPYPQFSIFD